MSRCASGLTLLATSFPLWVKTGPTRVLHGSTTESACESCLTIVRFVVRCALKSCDLELNETSVTNVMMFDLMNSKKTLNLTQTSRTVGYDLSLDMSHFTRKYWMPNTNCYLELHLVCYNGTPGTQSSCSAFLAICQYFFLQFLPLARFMLHVVYLHCKCKHSALWAWTKVSQFSSNNHG